MCGFIALNKSLTSIINKTILCTTENESKGFTMKTPDITYKDLGMFTVFLPETKEGENAWRELASVTLYRLKTIKLFLSKRLTP